VLINPWLSFNIPLLPGSTLILPQNNTNNNNDNNNDNEQQQIIIPEIQSIIDAQSNKISQNPMSNPDFQSTVQPLPGVPVYFHHSMLIYPWNV
jgi:hypothetical protein